MAAYACGIHFPASGEKFPVTRLIIPCSDWQGIQAQHSDPAWFYRLNQAEFAPEFRVLPVFSLLAGKVDGQSRHQRLRPDCGR